MTDSGKRLSDFLRQAKPLITPMRRATLFDFDDEDSQQVFWALVQSLIEGWTYDEQGNAVEAFEVPEEPQWTSERPTVPGWYWGRFDSGEQIPVNIRPDVIARGSYYGCIEFAGPITPPPTPQLARRSGNKPE